MPRTRVRGTGGPPFSASDMGRHSIEAREHVGEDAAVHAGETRDAEERAHRGGDVHDLSAREGTRSNAVPGRDQDALVCVGAREEAALDVAEEERLAVEERR